MKRRPRPSADLRPDWRDPEMPALFSCTDPKTGRTYLREISPDRATTAFARKLAKDDAFLPSWRDDPTYNLRKDQRK